MGSSAGDPLRFPFITVSHCSWPTATGYPERRTSESASAPGQIPGMRPVWVNTSQAALQGVHPESHVNRARRGGGISMRLHWQSTGALSRGNRSYTMQLDTLPNDTGALTSRYIECYHLEAETHKGWTRSRVCPVPREGFRRLRSKHDASDDEQIRRIASFGSNGGYSTPTGI